MEPGGELHHLAIAVPSLSGALPFWRDTLGLELIGIEEVASEKVRVAMLRAGSARIELLEPTGNDSPIASFLEKRGPGLHHVALRVRDVRAKSKEIAERGCPIIGAVARPGAHDSLVSFLHPKGTGGVLVELVQEHD